jgi:hypothetical protein
MKIPAVHEHDLDGGTTEFHRRLQAAEASAHDDDAVGAHQLPSRAIICSG